MFHLRLLGGILGFVAASLYGVAIALARRDRSRVAYDYGRAVARWVAPPLGIRARVVGAERLDDVRPCVLVANHQSMLDVPALAPAFRPGAVIIAKQEIDRVPFFGWLYRVTGNVRIDRGDTRGAIERLKEVEEAIRARKVAVWIFPEGTRGKEPGRMLPFKKGGFQVALLTGAPVVPVVVSPLKPRSDIQARRLFRNDVEVRVLEPIPTAGLGEGDLPALMREARRRMSAALVDQCLARGVVPPPETVRDAIQPAWRGSSLGSGGGAARSSSTGGVPGSGSTAVGGM